MNEFFHQLSRALTHEPVAMAIVVAARGSTPRVAGAKQFLTLSGKSMGTVGGGVAESRALELARKTLEDGLWRTYEADMRGKPGDTRDGVCGGVMTVWIIRLEAAHCLATIHALEESLRMGRKAFLSLQPEGTPLALVSPNEACGLFGNRFIEAINPPPHLLIVGAGHIGRSLAHVMHRLGFSLTVQDDRAEYLDTVAFPEDCALETHLEKAGDVLQRWEGGRFVALVTRGFGQDVEALKMLGSLPDLDYLGVLGSKARLATVFAACRDAGAMNPPPLVLHAPIGIELGAETPEEIAVSIAAEIIRVWRHGRGGVDRSSQ